MSVLTKEELFACDEFVAGLIEAGATPPYDPYMVTDIENHAPANQRILQYLGNRSAAMSEIGRYHHADR